jgi:hypothetical protein
MMYEAIENRFQALFEKRFSTPGQMIAWEENLP